MCIIQNQLIVSGLNQLHQFFLYYCQNIIDESRNENKGCILLLGSTIVLCNCMYGALRLPTQKGCREKILQIRLQFLLTQSCDSLVVRCKDRYSKPLVWCSFAPESRVYDLYFDYQKTINFIDSIDLISNFSVKNLFSIWYCNRNHNIKWTNFLPSWKWQLHSKGQTFLFLLAAGRLRRRSPRSQNWSSSSPPPPPPPVF